ncbi:MAG: hypothetical protein C0424_12405 [Sphingobacteriaceae bacterium]|nr:hypothetical protein [Sphingobacteriaceae bacterium]
MRTLLLYSLFLLLSLGEASGQFLGDHSIIYDPDSSGFEWTAASDYTGRLYVATLQEVNKITPETGMLRLKAYGAFNNTNPPSQTFYYPGKMRVSSLVDANTRLFLGGFFTDTSFLDSFNLIPTIQGQRKAFVAGMNAQNHRFSWVWQDSSSGSSRIHQLRHSNQSAFPQRLTISGSANDSTGMLVVLNATNGNIILQKHFPGIRTLSDAVADFKVPGSILLAGTCRDDGHISEKPIPLSGILTGIRSFWARYFPANDSVVFIRSLPYTRFDLLPTFSSNGIASLPTAIPSDPLIKQLFFDREAASAQAVDSARHKGYLLFHKDAFPRVPVPHLMELDTFLNLQFWQMKCRSCAHREAILEFDRWLPVRKTAIILSPFTDMVAFPVKSYIDIFNDFSFINLFYYFPPPLYYPEPYKHKWVIVRFLSRVETLAVAPKAKKEINIYPNPVNQGQFRIQSDMPFDQPALWTLRDVQGREVRQGQLAEIGEPISVAGLEPGMYFFELETSKGRGVQKLMISAR